MTLVAAPKYSFCLVAFAAASLFVYSIPASAAPPPPANGGPSDPGVRAVAVGAGAPLASLSAAELAYFQDGKARFVQTDSVDGSVAGEPGLGLGPTFNGNSCGQCHAQPAIGGSSPSASAYPNLGPNPQVALATLDGASNTVPPFISADGPVREARFPHQVNADGSLGTAADGGVHGLYTIAGREDAGSCALAQPDFASMQKLGNVIFRIPTPVFGAGLIENIADATILANVASNAALKQQLGIAGHTNTSGNDGSITRFGWKAQNKSLQIFAGEAYNVEMGVTNELFPTERTAAPAPCLTNASPEDLTNFTQGGAQILSDTVAFSNFMRFLAPPTPSSVGIPGNPPAQSIANGKTVFSAVHCDTCHTPSLQTATSIYASGLSNQSAALYSDLLVHNMGAGLADGVTQGSAGPNEFRTAPLWGLGQRVFFLHDGRAGPQNGGLVNAIRAHASQGSEANAVIGAYNNLPPQQQQDLLNFLRSL